MTQPRQTPAAPAAPAVSQPTTVQGTPAPNVVSTGQLSLRDLEALKARRTELSDQLRSANNRRRDVQSSLRTATTAADRSGLEQRLGVLDQRIARIESDIEENGRQLSSIQAMRTSTGASLPPRARGERSVELEPIIICFILFVLAPIAFSISRWFWKRSGAPKVTAHPENNERLLRMEQAIDSIAIEIERVSEGQRFVTRLLAEGKTPAQVGSVRPAAESLPVGSLRG